MMGLVPDNDWGLLVMFALVPVMPVIFVVMLAEAIWYDATGRADDGHGIHALLGGTPAYDPSGRPVQTVRRIDPNENIYPNPWEYR